MHSRPLDYKSNAIATMLRGHSIEKRFKVNLKMLFLFTLKYLILFPLIVTVFTEIFVGIIMKFFDHIIAITEGTNHTKIG